MSADDLSGALRARDMLSQIAADSDLSQQAKLFAFCLLAFITDPDRRSGGSNKRSWADIGDMMYAHRSKAAAIETVRHVISDDIPRYEVPFAARMGCTVAKTRGPNKGKPCGKNGTQWVERDPLTGEATRVCLCKQHLTSADRLRHRETYAQWVENGRPSPAANKGGVLARHFKANWAKLYEWANPSREPLPDGKPPTLPKPKLTLIQGGML